MFRILKNCLLAFIAMSCIACSESVDVNTFGPPVNVVYGLLNPDENTQYVRIGRSYNGSAFSHVNSPHPDSVTWTKEFSVYIEDWGEGIEVLDIFYFTPEKEIVKDTGFFPVEGLALYKGSFIPEPLHTYAVYVHFEEDDRITSAWTTMPGEFVIHDPKPIPGRKINLQQEESYTIRWDPVENAGIYQSFFRVFYRERTETDIGLRQINFNSQIFTDFTSTELLERTISGNRFFTEVINQVDTSFDARREIVNVSFDMFIGGEEFGLYLFNQLNGNHLSSSSSEYTNIRNGIGIFSSLMKYRVSNLQLSNTTLDELAYSERTRALGFLDHYGKRD